MTYLICYDITDDKLRTRIAKRLERAGCLRVQKSVFIAPHFEAKRLLILRGGILRLLAGKNLVFDESILAIPIEKDNMTDILWAGDSGQLAARVQKDLFKLL